MLSLSAHKFHGPKGTGVLYARRGIPLTSIIEGGAQERGKRAEPKHSGDYGMAACAYRSLRTYGREREKNYTSARQASFPGLSAVPHSALNGDPVNRLPGNVNFCFEGIEGESLLLLLDAKGNLRILGQRLRSALLTPAMYLLAIGLPHEVLHGSLRIRPERGKHK